jgi:hypothetical protein
LLTLTTWGAPMANNDVVRQTLEYYRQQRDAKASEMARLSYMIAQLEADLGEAPSSFNADSASLQGDMGGGPRSFTPAVREPDLRRDEFVGLTQVSAVKAYLKKVNRAVPLDQLAEAIKKGGATLGGAVPTKTLYVSLARNPNKEFVFLDDDYIGLREFYPSLPKASTARSASGRKAKSLKKSRKKPATHRKTKGEAPSGPSAPARVDAKESLKKKKGPPATEIKKALGEILKSGAALHIKPLTKAVQEKLGEVVHHLSVFKALQDKNMFEKTDEGFRSRRSAA